ncbi:MAG: tetratricopeptide repeat protein, partial [Candidatus Eisenbacteria bacterium]|nr:tetratricopeptide repeat protein [Candidatus Eisenbacteria bacterium]
NAPEGEAPAQIAGESILDLLSSLVEKSLVVFDPPPADRAAEAGVDRAGRGRDGSQPAAPRDEGGYRMLEMVREFAAAESAAAGEEEPLRARHLAYFTARADQALRQLSGADQDAWLLQLERENDNLRAAMRWAALPGGDAEMGMRTAIGLRRLWYVRGWMSEGVEHVRALLASPTLPPGSRARGLIAAANLEWARGDSVPARAHCEEALAMLQEIDDPAARAASLSMLGTIECDAGNYDRAVSLLEEGIELRRRAGVLAALTAPLLNLGVIHARRGDLDSAQRCYEEALAVARETEDRPSEGVCLGNLSATARDRGDLEKAESLAEQSLEILRATENHRGLGHGYRTLGSIRMQRGRLPEAEEALRMELRILRDSEDARQIFENLEAFARLLLAQGRFEASAILHGALDSVRAQKGYPIPPSEEPIREGDLARLREALGEKGFAAACARGGTMSLDQAVGFVEDGGPASAGEGSS